MKKGDIIQREIKVEKGEPLAHGFTTEELARNWIKHTNSASAEVKPDEFNEGKLAVVAKEDYTYKEEAEVQWLVDKEVAIKFSDRTYRVIDLNEEPDWVVVRESTPTYQSSVASMSDDELRGSIDSLRSKRVSLPKARRKVGARAPKSEMEKFIEKLPKADRIALMKKLGMVE